MRPQAITARARQLGRLLEREGPRGAALRVVHRLERRLGQGNQEHLGLHLQDVVDPDRLAPPVPPRPVSGRPLRIGWVSSPPSGGSGGHTTMLRMVEGLEAAGHDCALYLYDVYDGDVADRERTVRTHWPQIRASVHDVREGLPELDVWVATSWETAHVLAGRPEAGGHRFYFVQDHEPYFYANGSQAVFAADSYRFGFHGITAGRWLSDELTTRYGMTCDAFEFGTDTKIYQRISGRPRDGVVFYAKPDVPRRGYSLGLLALASFAERHPEVPVHLFGAEVGRLPFPAISHGRMSPVALNELYNSCRVGLSLSLTNVSLIPWELLAAGAVPVVNDAEHNRKVLDNDYVRWADPSPSALAAAIAEAYAENASPAFSAAAAAGVAGTGWDGAAEVVTSCIERVAAAGASR